MVIDLAVVTAELLIDLDIVGMLLLNSRGYWEQGQCQVETVGRMWHTGWMAMDRDSPRLGRIVSTSGYYKPAMSFFSDTRRSEESAVGAWSTFL